MGRTDEIRWDLDSLRKRAEATTGTTELQSLDFGSIEEAQRTIHELRVHQIELQMQNEELRRAQVELDAARERYFDLYDLAPVGYVTVSEKGLILEANLTAARLLGVERGALVKRRLASFVAGSDGDIYYLQHKRLLETGLQQVSEVRMVRPDSVQFWARIEAVKATGSEGTPVFRVVISDITERKQAEELRERDEALLASERRERERSAELAAVLDAVPVPVVIVHDPDSQHMTGNRATDELLRHPRGVEVSLSAPPDTRPRHFRAFKDGRELRLDELPAQRGARGEHVQDFEFSLVFDDGTVRELSAYATPLLDEQGKPRGAVHVLVDVTERRRAQEAARQSETRFRSVLDSSKDVIYRMNLQSGRYEYISPSAEATVGYSIGELMALDPEASLAMLHPDDLPAARAWMAQLEDSGAGELEYRQRTKDGDYRWMSNHASIVRDSAGRPLYRDGNLRDITERRRAEEAVQASEAGYRRLFEAMNEGFSIDEIICDESGDPCDLRYLAVNPAFERHTGLKAADIVGRTTLELFPAAEPIWFERYGKVALTGEPARFEERFGPLGRWFEVRAFQTEPGRVAVLFMDTTERKQMEEQLRNSETRLSTIFQRSPVGIVLSRLDDGRMVDVNAAFANLYGSTPDELIGRSSLELGMWVNPADRETLRNQLLAQGFCRNLEAKGRTMCGDLRDLVISVELLELGCEQFALGLVRDITEPKQAQEELRESEKRYRNLFNSMDEGFCIIEMIFDSEGKPADYRFLTVNAAFEAQTGMHDAEGKRMREFAPDHEAHWFEIYGRIALTGEPVNFFNEAKELNRYYDVHAYRVGKPEQRRVAIVFNDISGLKRAEKEREATIEFLALVNQSRGTNDLIQRATAFFQERSGCEAVGIRLREGEDYPYFEARGFSKEFLLLENKLCARDVSGEIIRDDRGNPLIECMCGNVICGRFEPSKPFFTAHGSFWSNSTTELLASTIDSDRQSRTRNRCNGEGYESVALIPLLLGDERFGLLQLNDRRKGQFSAEVIALWERLAGYLATALSKFRADEALQQSEAQFRTLADSIPQLAWMANADGWIFWYNQRWYSYTGTTLKEMEGWGWQSVHDPDELPTVLERWKGSIASGEPFDMVLPLRGADGVFRPFLTRVMPLRDSQGRVVRWFGTNTDISSQKQAEQALLRSEKLASVGRMAATIAHEINNPLEAVTNLLFLAATTKELPDSARQHLEIADAELKRVAHITRQSLGFYRESNAPALTSVNELLESTIDLLKSKIKTKQAVIEKQWDKDVEITANGGELRQVFSNLLANSLEAIGERGTIRLRVSTCAALKNGHRYVRVTIADNGTGIGANVRQQLFEPFFTTKGAIGTGLGLWVSKQIIDKHNGIIRVRSTTGGTRNGTVFSVILPIVN